MQLVFASDNVGRVTEELRLLTVHAHPDDEASKGAGTVAKYKAEGIKSLLVCCTGGEAGDILNPAMDTEYVKANLAKVRREELDRAADVIGYDEVVMLGYRDSGMPDMEENNHRDAFANADLDEAVERLVKIIRRFRPHVIVTYSDHQQGYLHPDHLRVNDITLPAFERAGSAGEFPDAGEPWEPAKLYYTAWSSERLWATHNKAIEINGESPYPDQFTEWFDLIEAEDHLITTKVNIEGFWDNRCDALIAHATQVAPDDKFWFALPREVDVELYPWEDYELARSRVSSTTPEDDLFAGLRG